MRKVARKSVSIIISSCVCLCSCPVRRAMTTTLDIPKAGLLISLAMLEVLDRNFKNTKTKSLIPKPDFINKPSGIQETKSINFYYNSTEKYGYKKLSKCNVINKNIIEWLQKLCFLQIDDYDKYKYFLDELKLSNSVLKKYGSRDFFENIYKETCVSSTDDSRKLYLEYIIDYGLGYKKSEFMPKLKTINDFFVETNLVDRIDKFYVPALKQAQKEDKENEEKRKNDLKNGTAHEKRQYEVEYDSLKGITDEIKSTSGTCIEDIRIKLVDDPGNDYSSDFIELYNSKLNENKQLYIHEDFLKERRYSNAYAGIDIKEVLSAIGITQTLPKDLTVTWYESNIDQINNNVKKMFDKWFSVAKCANELSVSEYAFGRGYDRFKQIITSGEVVPIFEEFIKFLYNFDKKAKSLGFNNYKDIESFSKTDNEKTKFKELWQDVVGLWGALNGTGCYNQLISAINYVLMRYSNYVSEPITDSKDIVKEFSTRLFTGIADKLVCEYSKEHATTCWAPEAQRTLRTIVYNFLNINTPLRVYDGRGFNNSLSIGQIVRDLNKELTVKNIINYIKEQLKTDLFSFEYKKAIVKEFSQCEIDVKDFEILKQIYGPELQEQLTTFINWYRENNTVSEERSLSDVADANCSGITYLNDFAAFWDPNYRYVFKTDQYSGFGLFYQKETTRNQNSS